MNPVKSLLVFALVGTLSSCSETHKNKRVLSRYPSGAVKSEYSSLANKDEGEVIWHLESGGIRSREKYLNGKMEGIQTDYFANGKKSQEIFYKHGVAEGPFVFYRPDGSKEREGMMHKGHKLGNEKLYYSTGGLQTVIIEKNDTTYFIEYFFNGHKRAAGQRVYGKLDGLVTAYDSVTNDSVQGIYKNGKLLL